MLWTRRMADALVEIVPLYTVIIVDTMYRIAFCEIQHRRGHPYIEQSS
jgi:hypothetical protein